MAQITYDYVPADGNLVDITGWNGDIWKLTAGKSIYGELNGHFQDANFVVGAQVQPQHIRPNEGHAAVQAGGTETLDFVDLLFGTTDSPTDADWLVVGTSGTRVYMPWDSTAATYSVAAFLTNQRQREITDPTDPDHVVSGPEMYVRMRIDGTGIPHTLRKFPYTYTPASVPGEAKSMNSREAVLTHHFDLVHLATDGVHVTKGWHNVSLEVLIPRTQDQESLLPLYKTGTKYVPFSLRHRIRFGVRRATIIAM
jgi:hypothetical protein